MAGRQGGAGVGLFVVGCGRGKLGMVQTQERRKEPAERVHSGVLKLEFGAEDSLQGAQGLRGGHCGALPLAAADGSGRLICERLRVPALESGFDGEGIHGWDMRAGTAASCRLEQQAAVFAGSFHCG